MPSVEGNAKRDTSGLGGSILMTSAPRSCRVRAQSGPASTREKSTTRSPLRGPLMSAPHEFCEARTALAERCEAKLEVFRGPDRRLHARHRLVGCGDAFIRRDVDELLGRRMRQCGPLCELLGN